MLIQYHHLLPLCVCALKQKNTCAIFFSFDTLFFSLTSICRKQAYDGSSLIHTIPSHVIWMYPIYAILIIPLPKHLLSFTVTVMVRNKNKRCEFATGRRQVEVDLPSVRLAEPCFFVWRLVNEGSSSGLYPFWRNSLALHPHPNIFKPWLCLLPTTLSISNSVSGTISCNVCPRGQCTPPTKKTSMRIGYWFSSSIYIFAH